MKTKIFSLVGAALAACTFTSCEVYAPAGYAYGGYGRSCYSSGYSPCYSGYPPFYRSYSRPVVIQSPRYPSHRYHHMPSSSWNGDRGHSHHSGSPWNHNRSGRSSSSFSRSSSSWLNNRTTTSIRTPSFRSTGLSTRSSTSLGSSGSSWSPSGGHGHHRGLH